MSTNPTTPSDNTVEAIRDFLVKGDYRTDTNVGLNRTAQAIHSLTTQARIDENRTYWWHQQKLAEKEGVSKHSLDRIKQLKGQL